MAWRIFCLHWIFFPERHHIFLLTQWTIFSSKNCKNQHAFLYHFFPEIFYCCNCISTCYMVYWCPYIFYLRISDIVSSYVFTGSLSICVQCSNIYLAGKKNQKWNIWWENRTAKTKSLLILFKEENLKCSSSKMRRLQILC